MYFSNSDDGLLLIFFTGNDLFFLNFSPALLSPFDSLLDLLEEFRIGCILVSDLLDLDGRVVFADLEDDVAVLVLVEQIVERGLARGVHLHTRCLQSTFVIVIASCMKALNLVLYISTQFQFSLPFSGVSFHQSCTLNHRQNNADL